MCAGLALCRRSRRQLLRRVRDDRDGFRYRSTIISRPRSAKTLKGLINVNTARWKCSSAFRQRVVTESDAQTLVSSQTTASSTPGVSWVFAALPPAKAVSILPYITVRSYQYSADIVAVSGDGRAFKRVRIVLDTTTLPPKIVYRRDLTSYGWPLPQQIQDSMRAGKGPLAIHRDVRRAGHQRRSQV